MDYATITNTNNNNSFILWITVSYTTYSSSEHHITDIFSHINNNDYGIGKKPTHGVVKNVGLNFVVETVLNFMQIRCGGYIVLTKHVEICWLT